MRQLLTGLLVLGLFTQAGQSDDRPAPAAEQSKGFQALKQEFDKAQKEFLAKRREAIQALREAKTDDEKKDAQAKFKHLMKENPGLTFSRRFLDFAALDPRDPSAFEALSLALRTSGGPQAKDGAWAKILAVFARDHAASPQMKTLIRGLAGVDDEATERLLRKVAATNPDRKIQGRAYQALAESYDSLAESAEDLKNDAGRKQMEQERGKEYVETLLARAEKAPKEAEEVRKILREQYADVIPDLSVGKPAPEVVSQDLDGKPVRLSDLKGKVVVLNIWATWCGPCRAMIPHERDMVERLKDKPFALVGINADTDKKDLTDFLAKEKMPWAHWWNGPDGGVLEDWNVRYFPTIYILDAQGVIRHKDLRNQEMEKAVEKLLKEIEPKTETPK